MPRVQRICLEDVRQGADRLHELLDGKFVIPDALGVALVGVLGALLPIAVLILVSGVELSI